MRFSEHEFGGLGGALERVKVVLLGLHVNSEQNALFRISVA